MSMYDRLGDLLSETLEAGEVRYVKKEIPEEKKEASSEEKSGEKTEEKSHASKNQDEYRTQDQKENPPKKTKTVYKKITSETESAFRLLGITFSATAEDAKKAYREKIKLFHPDRYGSNRVMQTVASKKTHQVVEAYRKVLDFLSE